MPIDITPDINELKKQLDTVTKAQAGSDKKYQETAKPLKAQLAENEKLKSSLSKEADLIARLDRIYKGFEQREAARELKFYSRVQCLEKSIPFKLIENENFPDREAVDSRLAVVSETLDQVRISGIENQLQTSRPPQTGASSEPVKVFSLEALQGAFHV